LIYGWKIKHLGLCVHRISYPLQPAFIDPFQYTIDLVAACGWNPTEYASRIDRLFIQNQMERDRHAQEMAELTKSFEQQRAADQMQHEANLKAMQLATLQQREHRANEVCMYVFMYVYSPVCI